MLFLCNFVKDLLNVYDDKTRWLVLVYTLSTLVQGHVLIQENLQWCSCRTSIIHTKTHNTVNCNLEQNVYSNQKEELDKRLNNSEHSIFIEYLYIVMINRQKKKEIKTKHTNGEWRKFSEWYCTLFLKCYRSRLPVLYLWTFQLLPLSSQKFSLVLTLDYSEAQANGLWNWPTWNKYVSLFITV